MKWIIYAAWLASLAWALYPLDLWHGVAATLLAFSAPYVYLLLYPNRRAAK